MTTFKQRVLGLIDELGPQTMRSLAEQMGLTRHQARCRLGKMRATYPEALRIVAYERDELGGRMYPCAVYGRGPGPNAPRPLPLNNTQYNRRYRAKKTGRVNSVFALARPVDARRLTVFADTPR